MRSWPYRWRRFVKLAIARAWWRWAHDLYEEIENSSLLTDRSHTMSNAVLYKYAASLRFFNMSHWLCNRALLSSHFAYISLPCISISIIGNTSEYLVVCRHCEYYGRKARHVALIFMHKMGRWHNRANSTGAFGITAICVSGCRIEHWWNKLILTLGISATENKYSNGAISWKHMCQRLAGADRILTVLSQKDASYIAILKSWKCSYILKYTFIVELIWPIFFITR